MILGESRDKQSLEQFLFYRYLLNAYWVQRLVLVAFAGGGFREVNVKKQKGRIYDSYLKDTPALFDLFCYCWFQVRHLSYMFIY